MTARVHLARLCAAVAVFYVVGHTQRLASAQVDTVQKATRTALERPHVGTTQEGPDARAKAGRRAKRVRFAAEEPTDEEDLAEAQRRRNRRAQGDPRKSRRGSPEKKNSRNLLNLSAGVAAALVATTALLSWLLFARFHGAAKEDQPELPAITTMPEVRVAAKAEKPAEKPKAELPKEIKKQENISAAINTKAFDVLLALSVIALLAAPFVFPEQTAKLVERAGQQIDAHPVQSVMFLLAAQAVYLALRRLKIGRPKEKEMDWAATADLFVKQTAAKDRKNLKLRLGQALQLIAGAEEQGRGLHAHPLQLRDFRIGAYATSLWLAAAARFARLSLPPQDPLQAEMRKVLDLSDALRRLADVSPLAESLDLELKPYQRSWGGNLKLPKISKADLSNLGNLISKIHRKLPA